METKSNDSAVPTSDLSNDITQESSGVPSVRSHNASDADAIVVDSGNKIQKKRKMINL